MTNPNLDATMEAIDNSSFCPEAKRDAKKIFIAFAGEKAEETYAIGQRFTRRGTEWLLTVGGGRGLDAMLINPSTGRNKGSATKVGSLCRITKAEFASFCGCGTPDEFTRIEKP